MVDRHIQECFTRLKSPEFRPLVEFLKSRREGVGKDLVVLDDSRMLFRAQGRAIELDYLLDRIEKSTDR